MGFASDYTYELVVANDRHNTEWLHAILLGTKGGACAFISEDDVWVEVGV